MKSTTEKKNPNMYNRSQFYKNLLIVLYSYFASSIEIFKKNLQGTHINKKLQNNPRNLIGYKKMPKLCSILFNKVQLAAFQENSNFFCQISQKVCAISLNSDLYFLYILI